MPKVAKMFRLSEDLADRVEARAGELGQTQTVFVERALEAWLGNGPTTWPTMPNGPEGRIEQEWSAKEIEQASKALRGQDRDGAAKKLLDSTEPRRFRCGCATTATSPKAICPKHGKRLAEV